MVKAVFFDLDGTLLNREESIKAFISDQYHRLHTYLHHIPKDLYIGRFIELDARGYVWKDKVYKQLIVECNISGVGWEELLQDYLTHFKYHCVPFPNLQSMLDQLKMDQLTLGIITNGKGQFQLDNIRALSIEHYFDCIFVSELEGLKKPDPRIFQRALKKFEILPHEAVFIGDHPENDVKAAQAVGMKAIWKKDDFWKTGHSTFTIHDLSEICTLITQMKKHSTSL
ncbi:HAD family hydrolase [Anaerobacillus alkaliphilus]|uniref:HAD family hydrolase n=1 Tax=Anaerobacillus alkaliphilus TaxID=1548597 RepID=A0A4Q0VMX8_9BACI|nr:HAD family hydrolase [Anaerobacillus alkaliphilus]RXI96757.1 HAD family hydrolase [Anaerobacillus alkaliphilus]